MKKVMFVLVSLLIVSTFAFALESGPSNKVGYVKIQCNGGTSPVYTAFGLPFKFWYVPAANIPTYGTESRKPSSIVGTQTFCGTSPLATDRIVRQDGEFAQRVQPNCLWVGFLESNPQDMEPGRAYWYYNHSGANRNLVLAGEADTTGTGIPTFTIAAPGAPGGAANQPYSWRDPRDVATNRLNLVAQGFTGGSILTSDKVVIQGGSGLFAYYTGSAWAGGLTAVTPGAAYWIQNKHFGHPFNYTYVASGVPIVMPGGGPAVIQKVSAPVVVPVHRAGKATNQ